MTAREQGGDVDVAALVEVAQARGAVTLTAREMAAVARKVADAWADADLARESEKGWRREADELAERLARVAALADGMDEIAQRCEERDGTICCSTCIGRRGSAKELRAALGGES